MVTALLADSAVTYQDVAASAGVTVGTVHTHLRRVRELAPDLWELVAVERQRLLELRHEAAQLRAAAHSRQWFRRQANRRYRERFGRWPWERW